MSALTAAPSLLPDLFIFLIFFYLFLFQLRILWCHSPYATAELFDEMKVSSACSFFLDCAKSGFSPPFLTPPSPRLSAPGDRRPMLLNRPFSSCFESHYESETKCKVFIIKISFYSYVNKTNFHLEDFALSLASITRSTATRKWPILLSSCHFFLVFDLGVIV